MLVQSRGDTIHLLPALPSAWPEGEVRGLRLRGGAEIDIAWTGGKLKEARIRSAIIGTRTVSAGKARARISHKANGAQVLMPSDFI
jgi:alpha-L-fucosidase 2